MSYAADRYFAHSKSEIVIQALKLGEDIITQKISQLLNVNDNKSLIAGVCEIGKIRQRSWATHTIFTNPLI